MRDGPLAMATEAHIWIIMSRDAKVETPQIILFDSPHAFVLESGAATMTMETV